MTYHLQLSGNIFRALGDNNHTCELLHGDRDGPAQRQWVVIKRWMGEYSCDVGLLCRRTCHGPLEGALIQRLCLGIIGPCGC